MVLPVGRLSNQIFERIKLVSLVPGLNSPPPLTCPLFPITFFLLALHHTSDNRTTFLNRLYFHLFRTSACPATSDDRDDRSQQFRSASRVMAWTRAMMALAMSQCRARENNMGLQSAVSQSSLMVFTICNVVAEAQLQPHVHGRFCCWLFAAAKLSFVA